jgi:uncharacterized membrane protein YagU involved in acid resistance
MGWLRTPVLRNGIIAGLVATTTMNASYWAERRVRRNVEGPLDYDDSNVPALVAAKLLRPVVRNTELSDDASRWLGFAVHWGYGSLFGLGAVPLIRRFGPVGGTAVYWSGMMVMACVMFPVLGATPPPWRWRNDVIVTSAAQHVVYAATATAVLSALARSQRDAGRAAVADAGDEDRGAAGTGVTAKVSGAAGTSGAREGTA